MEFILLCALLLSVGDTGQDLNACELLALRSSRLSVNAFGDQRVTEFIDSCGEQSTWLVLSTVSAY